MDRSSEARADAEGVLDHLGEMGRPADDIDPLRNSLPQTEEFTGEPFGEASPIETALKKAGKY